MLLTTTIISEYLEVFMAFKVVKTIPNKPDSTEDPFTRKGEQLQKRQKTLKKFCLKKRTSKTKNQSLRHGRKRCLNNS